MNCLLFFAALPQHIAESAGSPAEHLGWGAIRAGVLDSGFPASSLFLNRGYASAARRSLAVNLKITPTVRRSLTAMCGGKAARALHLSRFPIYYSKVMAKERIQTEQRTVVHAEGRRHKPSRKYVHSLRGKLKGKGLLKALMTEKEKEQRS